MKTTYIKISQILLFKIEFTHLNFFLESPRCLITNENEISENFLPCRVTIFAKIARVDKSDFFFIYRNKFG